MNWVLNLSRNKALIIYVIADLFCIALGMGLPFFCILLGFPVGWYLTKRIYNPYLDMKDQLSRIFKYALICSSFTLVIMILIWGSIVPMLWDSNAEIANFGIPLILYDPKMSFIGWLILMIFISPLLQIMTTIFTAFTTLMRSKI
jgi:hypothetical protein